MHQSIIAKIENYAYKDWIVLNVMIKHSINSIKNGDNKQFIAIFYKKKSLLSENISNNCSTNSILC